MVPDLFESTFGAVRGRHNERNRSAVFGAGSPGFIDSMIAGSVEFTGDLRPLGAASRARC